MFPFFPEQPCRRPDSLSLACENQAPPSEPPPGESLRGKGEAAGFPEREEARAAAGCVGNGCFGLLANLDSKYWATATISAFECLRPCPRPEFGKNVPDIIF